MSWIVRVYSDGTQRDNAADPRFGGRWKNNFRGALHEHLWDVFCVQWPLVCISALVGRE